jgi:F0F1-type ATP synthase assembly protein I
VPDPELILRWGRLLALLWDFAGSVLAGSALGWAVDRWFGTEPYGILSLTILGVVGGFVRLVTSLRRFDRLDNDQ